MIVANTTFSGAAGESTAKEPVRPTRVAGSDARGVAAPASAPEKAVESSESRSRSELLNNESRRGRLAFDEELSRVFVEIVDPRSGEVILRFPPEQIVRHVAELKEAKAQAAKSGDTGLVLDQVV